MNAETVALSCNVHSDISKNSNHVLEINVGPEVLTGSTRLKSGTAQKISFKYDFYNDNDWRG